MPNLSISRVARSVGLRPSAIRYYEQIGILPAARRVNGRRVYQAATVNRLAVLRRAQAAGFTLDEIRELFFGFGASTPISARWKKLTETKLNELDMRIEQLRSMKDVLERLRANCNCETVDECGAGLRSQ